MVTDEDILKIENRIYKKLREQGSFAIIDDGTAEKELSRLLLNYHKDRIWLDVETIGLYTYYTTYNHGKSTM